MLKDRAGLLMRPLPDGTWQAVVNTRRGEVAVDGETYDNAIANALIVWRHNDLVTNHYYTREP